MHLLDQCAAWNRRTTGLGLSLSETPRAIDASGQYQVTLDRYGVTGMDSLTAITPGAYTASFYGVEGSVNLRGTLADNYFRGFQRAENLGTYDTLMDGDVTLVRGAAFASLWRGQGRVSGMVDFEPVLHGSDGGSSHPDSMASAYSGITQPESARWYALRTWAAQRASCALRRQEITDDSFSYYHSLHPSHQSLNLGADLAGEDWSLSANYLFYHSDGDVQTPGWNYRLTQNLIDSGTYVTSVRDTIADRMPCTYWPPDPERTEGGNRLFL